MHFVLSKLHTAWPLFDLEKQITNEHVYVVISGLPDLRSRPDTWRHLLNEWHRLERACWHDGIRGMLAGCQIVNPRFIQWLKALGAVQYAMTEDAEDGTMLWFQKIVTGLPKPVSLRDLNPKMREATIQQEGGHV